MITGSAWLSKSGGTTAAEIGTVEGRSVCLLPPLPRPRAGHTQSGLIVCGGIEDYHDMNYNNKSGSCVTFIGGTWTITQKIIRREQHSSWFSRVHGLVLMGGHIHHTDDDDYYVTYENANTTDKLTITQLHDYMTT